MRRVLRKTKETNVRISLELAAGEPQIRVATGKPFFDHMLSTFARYAGLSLQLKAEGDLTHHLMEDVAITLGKALRGVVPATAARYGERTIPMDEALVSAVIDVGGRFTFVGELPNRLYTHVLRSLADALGATLHILVLRGKDRHHIIEAAFKALGLALRQALQQSGEAGVFSTKGAVLLEEEDE